jgi:Tfp pilus assembly protein PilO
LNRQVAELQVYERRNAEFKVEMAALEKQLDTLKTIVPEEKEVGRVHSLLQEAASASGVQIRSLTPQAVVPKDYHYELPFTIAWMGRTTASRISLPGSAGCPESSMWGT